MSVMCYNRSDGSYKVVVTANDSKGRERQLSMLSPKKVSVSDLCHDINYAFECISKF